MPSRITIISEGLAFITGALSKNLQQAGFEVNVITPKIKEVNEYRNQTDIFLVYADIVLIIVYEIDVVILNFAGFGAQRFNGVWGTGYTEYLTDFVAWFENIGSYDDAAGRIGEGILG